MRVPRPARPAASSTALVLWALAGCGGATSTGTPDQDASVAYDTCDVASDCVIRPASCCGRCGVATRDDVVALNATRVTAYLSSQCQEPVACTDCYTPQDPRLVATCRAGKCDVIDLATHDATACTAASDCRVRSNECCECGAAINVEHVVAVANEGAFASIVCNPTQACDLCAPVYPPEVSAACSGGHCEAQWLDASGGASGGGGTGGGGAGIGGTAGGGSGGSGGTSARAGSGGSSGATGSGGGGTTGNGGATDAGTGGFEAGVAGSGGSGGTLDASAGGFEGGLGGGAMDAGTSGSGGGGTGGLGSGGTGGSAGSGGSGGACAPACGAGRECCGGTCVNTANDPSHCGKCGVTCGPGTYCNGSGQCTVPPCTTTCGSGSLCCAGECCGAGEICCDPQGPLSTTPTCTVPGASGTCPQGCAPLCACAAPHTPIATPEGDRPIATLAVGDLIYSVEGAAVVVVPIVRTNRNPVTNHRVMRVVLESGVILEISGRHPTADGRLFASLHAGDALGGVAITSISAVPYEHDATYDVLPASSTGAYFAGGVLVGSTLAGPDAPLVDP